MSDAVVASSVGDRSTGQSEPRTANEDGDMGALSLLLFPFVAFVFAIMFVVVRQLHQWGEARKEQRALAQLDALPITTWVESVADVERQPQVQPLPDDDDERDYDKECTLCLERYKSGDALRTLPCSHFFHKECVDKWLFEKQVGLARTCPLCKSDPASPSAPPAHSSSTSHTSRAVPDAGASTSNWCCGPRWCGSNCRSVRPATPENLTLPAPAPALPQPSLASTLATSPTRPAPQVV